MRITTVVQWIRLGLLAGTAHAQEPRAEPVVSNNANDVLIRGNDLVKTGANVAWDAGASFQSITAGHDGYVEFTAGLQGCTEWWA